ncbi:hypothetical protein V6N13_058905 [Hibiscus sabdariffa]|uniref:Uncharacterized protein n=1 Tax=Hibiscus sabdariffa TaxID=183260 RepID=A0ABR2GFZ0_9ROSI
MSTLNSLNVATLHGRSSGDVGISVERVELVDDERSGIGRSKEVASKVLVHVVPTTIKYGTHTVLSVGDNVKKANGLTNKIVGSTSTGSGLVSVGLARRLTKVKSVARKSPYPQRTKPQSKQENRNPNMIDIGEWVSKTSKGLTDQSGTQNAKTSKSS